MFTYDKRKFIINENVKSQKNNSNINTCARCSGYTHQQTFFGTRGHISPLLLFLHTFLATEKKHTQGYPQKVSNEKGKDTTTLSSRMEMELRPWRDPLLMLESQVPFSTHFHCNTSFLLRMFSNVKAIKIYKGLLHLSTLL